MALQTLYHSREQEILDDFLTFLRFASVSSEPEYGLEMINCLEWLQHYVEEIGFTTEIWPTSGHPVLFANWEDAGRAAPTLLIYNHYDVQPPEPLEEWVTPPFEPTIRNGQIYARGAQDNKGQCFYVLQALKLLFAKHGTLPINVKLCIEGEEECGSHGLMEVLNAKRQQLQADYLAVVDLDIKSPTQPALTLGLRGIVTFDLEATGSKIDLHSGYHGGITYNPLHALVEVLAKLRDNEGKVTIPGFYDDIVPLKKSEVDKLAMTFDPQGYFDMCGAHATGGEKEFSPYESSWLRPTVEINGLSGGYAGSGFKTVIPAKAHAKLSCRLVAGQDPDKIGKLVAAYLEAQAPEGIDIAVTIRPGGGPACRSTVDSPLTTAFATAFAEVFNQPCEYIASGGSIPIISALAETSGSQVLLMGLGLDSDHIHAPNEHFGVDRLEKGALVVARGIELLGATHS
jgi:acetylornithine deacetylase/succinyl-diaminopimelate desuccinylase-like protein